MYVGRSLGVSSWVFRDAQAPGGQFPCLCLLHAKGRLAVPVRVQQVCHAGHRHATRQRLG